MPPTATCRAGHLPITKPHYEVADIFRAYGPQYRQTVSLPPSHRKVMHAIETCRTAELGGHVERCDACGFERNAYNSCRNRHCPKCQALAKAQWLQERQAEVLPVEYFHVVFSLPHELNPLTLSNKKVLLDLLFQVVGATLQEFGADPQHGLGGRIGFTAVLHTWDQRLLDHFHLHCLVPGGALSFDGRRFVRAKRGYLFPVKALSRVFRGKFLEGLKKRYAQRQIVFPKGLNALGTEEGFARLVDQLWQKEWVVYSKAPFDGPEKVLEYLGRYTHRVAISNHRLVNVAEGMVTFRYRDRRDHDQVKETTISAQEFIRRFLLHVVPDSYKRIRHFGFLANGCKKRDLTRCRELLGLPAALPLSPPESLIERMLRLTGVDITQCPRCKQGHMTRVKELPLHPACASQDWPVELEAFDTS
jgi:predicted Zn-ribbon and HTH transcriptional regulator